MHEHAFIQSIIAQVPNPEKTIGITVEVGELAGIEEEHLKEHLFDETGWDVTTIQKESLVECTCGYKGRARIKERLHDLVIFDCPLCGHIPKVLQGKYIKVLRAKYKE